MPCLTLADLPDKPEELPLETTRLSGLPVLMHRVDTNGITYLVLYFDADGLDAGQLDRLGYLCQLLGHMPTRTHTAEQLNDRIRLICGDLQFFANAVPCKDQNDRCRVRFCVAVSAPGTQAVPGAGSGLRDPDRNRPERRARRAGYSCASCGCSGCRTASCPATRWALAGCRPSFPPPVWPRST